MGYHLNYDNDEFIVLLNASPKVDEEFKLPEGHWDILVDPLKTGIEKMADAEGKLLVKPVSGFVLRKSK